MNTIETQIISKTHVLNNLYKFELERIDNSVFQVKPGQFFMINLEDDEGKFTRSYSVTNPIKNNECRILEFIIAIAESGRSAAHIQTWKVGTLLTMTGPHGRFRLREEDKNIIAIATGTGIAPYRSMMFEFEKKSQNGEYISIIHGARNYEEAIYADGFLDTAEEEENFAYHLCLSQEKNPFYIHGRVQTHVRKMTLPEDTTYLLCGNPNMVEEVKTLLLERGVDRRSLRTESYTSPS